MYSGLTNITIPGSITSIADQAFLQCTALKDVTILNGVTSIGVGVFSGCTSLTEIYYDGTKEQWTAISGSSSISKNIAIFYTPYQSNTTTVYYDGTTTKFYITPDTEYSGNTIVCALYKNQILSDIKIFTYSGNTLEYATTKPNDEIKIMVWKGLSSITPMCNPERIISSEWQ